jgi:predicted nucleic acid-binding protein
MSRCLEVVIDSSVVVKSFSEEEATPHALELRESRTRDHATLITTHLLACELASALRYRPDCNKGMLAEVLQAPSSRGPDKRTLKVSSLSRRSCTQRWLERSAQLRAPRSVTSSCLS